MSITKQEFEKIEQILDKKLDQKLDQKLANFATKDDLKGFATKDDLRSLEQRINLKFEGQTKELKAFAEEQTEHLALIIGETVAIPLQQHIESCQKVGV